MWFRSSASRLRRSGRNIFAGKTHLTAPAMRMLRCYGILTHMLTSFNMIYPPRSCFTQYFPSALQALAVNRNLEQKPFDPTPRTLGCPLHTTRASTNLSSTTWPFILNPVRLSCHLQLPEPAFSVGFDTLRAYAVSR